MAGSYYIASMVLDSAKRDENLKHGEGRYRASRLYMSLIFNNIKKEKRDENFNLLGYYS